MRVEDVPDPAVQDPTDAVVRVVRASVCGSDLHRWHDQEPSTSGRPMGHELLGVVEAVGGDVTSVRPGNFVISPFGIQDNSCVFCREGVHTSCVQGRFFGTGGVGGAQAEAVRIPLADGTLVKAGVALEDTDEAMLASLRDAWGVEPVETGIGGSIPFTADLLEVFPEATLLITGVEDPDSRAHSANESLHLDEWERACVAEVVLLARLGALPR